MAGGADAGGSRAPVGAGNPLGVVVGNPKPGSRTRTVAEAVARAVGAGLGEALGIGGEWPLVVELATLGPQLFDWSSVEVKDAVRAFAGCRVLIVASPTYKATYTGLLKSFLDWFTTTGLSGVCAVPVMVGAGPGHALAVEVHLRPVLVEIGATVPTRGLYVTEGELEELDALLGRWLPEALPLLRSALARPPGSGPADPPPG